MQPGGRSDLGGSGGGGDCEKRGEGEGETFEHGRTWDLVRQG
jgi:hypothetical protein